MAATLPFNNDSRPDTDVGDVQKKISLLSNPSALVGELFPHSAGVSSFLGLVSGGESEATSRRSGLVLVASLVSKTPNLGGKLLDLYGGWREGEGGRKATPMIT